MNVFRHKASQIALISIASVWMATTVRAEDFGWTYDFESGVLADDWEFNTNSPVVKLDYFAPSGTVVAEIQQSGTTVFHAAAIHQDNFDLSVGDKLTANLAWSPGFAKEVAVSGYNEVLQLGVLNLDDSWGSSTETFSNGDGIWLSAREVSATAPTVLDEWGTATIDFWIHTDEASTGNPATADYLGRQTIDTFKQGSGGEIAMKFLDIHLEFEVQNGGVIDYGVGVGQWEFTFGVGSDTWVDEGDLVDYLGSRSHDLLDTSGLHPSFGHLVSDSSSQGVSNSYWANGSTPVPEPSGCVLAMLGAGLLINRRSR